MDDLSREPAVPRARAGSLLIARRIAAALLAVALTAASCGGGAGTSGAPGVDSAAPVATASTPALTPATVEDVLEEVRTPGPRATVVNVWATWCTPCREEFPELMALHAAYRDSGLRLMLVSADFTDQADEARAFLASQGVDFDTYLKQGNDMQFINTMNPRWSGALPATLVYDADARLTWFHEGRFSRPDLEAALVEALHAASPTGG